MFCHHVITDAFQLFFLYTFVYICHTHSTHTHMGLGCIFITEQQKKTKHCRWILSTTISVAFYMKLKVEDLTDKFKTVKCWLHFPTPISFFQCTIIAASRGGKATHVLHLSRSTDINVKNTPVKVERTGLSFTCFGLGSNRFDVWRSAVWYNNSTQICQQWAMSLFWKCKQQKVQIFV